MYGANSGDSRPRLCRVHSKQRDVLCPDGCVQQHESMAKSGVPRELDGPQHVPPVPPEAAFQPPMSRARFVIVSSPNIEH